MRAAAALIQCLIALELAGKTGSTGIAAITYTFTGAADRGEKLFCVSRRCELLSTEKRHLWKNAAIPLPPMLSPRRGDKGPCKRSTSRLIV